MLSVNKPFCDIMLVVNPDPVQDGKTKNIAIQKRRLTKEKKPTEINKMRD